jgi:hypothetical protein
MHVLKVEWLCRLKQQEKEIRRNKQEKQAQQKQAAKARATTTTTTTTTPTPSPADELPLSVLQQVAQKWDDDSSDDGADSFIPLQPASGTSTTLAKRAKVSKRAVLLRTHKTFDDNIEVVTTDARARKV